MGPVSVSLYFYEDPWIASAFFFTFLQLLLTVLVLVHTVIVCITCQLIKWCGLGYPDGNFQRDATLRFDSGVLKKPLDLYSNGSRRTPLISTERFLKRSRCEDGRAVKSRSFVCPNCYGVWNPKQGLSFRYDKGAKQGLSFRYDKGANSHLRETPTLSDAAKSHSGRVTLAEANPRSNAEHGPRAYIGEKVAGCQFSCFDPSGASQKILNSELVGKPRDGAGHERLEFASVNFNVDNCDTTGDAESCSNIPVLDLPRPGKEAAIESAVHREALREEVASSSKEPRGNRLNRAPLKSNGAEEDLRNSELALPIQKEIQEEIMDENFAAVPRKEGENKEGSYESVINGSWVDGISALKDDKKGYDSESVIKGLKEAVLRERKKLCTLYAELEIERISSETAANEAMSMMSRLQEEKAALCMQAAHYRRIAEERAIYDEQAMQILKDILVKKEKENFLLEKDVKAMRTRCCRDVKTYGKKRHGVDTPECCETLLLNNEDDAEWVHSLGRKKKESGGQQSSLPLVTEKQTFKRLKSNMHHETLSSQKLLFALGVHSNTQSAVSGHVLGPYCFCEHQHSVTSIKNNLEEVFDNVLVIQEKTTVSEGEHVPSENEKLLDNSENKIESLEGLLMSSSTLSTAANSVQGWKPSWSDTSDSQACLPPVIEEDIAKKENEENQLGECSLSKREAICPEHRVMFELNTLALCYSDEVSSNVPACTEETGVFASTDVLQFGNMVLECNMRKDLQARGQIFQVDRLPQSCPSSLNHKGSVFNNIEESDSSLLRSHAH